MNPKILVIGAFGQLGNELTVALRKQYGQSQIITADIRSREDLHDEYNEQLNVLDKEALFDCIEKHSITQIYHLAATLSARGEKNPLSAWELNMDSLINVLEAAREYKLEKIFWPSSIAVFGPDTPKEKTPQQPFMNPATMYGVSKLAGERWCEYYFLKYGVDVRSLRFPGIISYRTPPGGGTTDYAIETFYKAIDEGAYRCFLNENTYLPMMYIDDAVRGTLQLMNASKECLTVRSSYNIGAVSFCPSELARELRKYIPHFSMSYSPDNRQQIAATWPKSVNDLQARKDWSWEHEFDLPSIVSEMLMGVRMNNKQAIANNK